MAADLGDAEIRVRPVVDKRQAQKSGEDAAGQVGRGFAGKAKGIGGTFAKGIVTGIGVGLAQNLPGMVGGFASDLFGLAASLEQIQRKAMVVFGPELDRARARLDGMAGSLGLSKNQALAAAAGIQDILVPMEFARDAATDLTLELIELGGALAANSGGTRTVEDAHRAVTSALTGEREQLKEYGVVISEAAVQTKMAALESAGMTFETVAQGKAVATLKLIQEQSKDAQDLFATGTDTIARKQAEAKARMREAKEELAQGLAPAFQAGAGFAGDFATAVAGGVGFVTEHKDAVLALTAAYVAYQGAQGIGGAISATRTFADVHGTLRNGLKQSLTSMNPWGVAAAGAVGLATVAIMRWKKQQAETKAKIAELNTTLRDQNGILTLAADAWRDYAVASGEWAKSSQLDDLQRIGFTVDDLQTALGNGEDGLRSYLQAALETNEIHLRGNATLDDVIAKWDELDISRRGVIETDEFGRFNLIGGNADIVDSYQETISAMAAADEAELRRIAVSGEYTDAARAQVQALLDQNLGTIDLVQAYEQLVPTITDGKVATDDATDATDDATTAAAANSDATDDQRTALEKLTDQYGTLTDMVDGARRAIDRMTGGQVTLDDATLDLQEQADRLTESLERNGATFDIGTDAGRSNMQQARDTAGAIRELELALVGSGMASDDAKDRTDVYRIALAEQLTTAGLTDDAISALIDTYGRVPTDVRTALIADTGESNRRMQTYLDWLHEIPATVTTNIVARTTGGSGRATRFAHGGRPPVGRDVIVGEAGPELMRFDQPGRIVPNHQLGQVTTSAGVTVGTLNVTVAGSVDATDPAAVRDFAVRLRDELVSLEASDR